MLKSESLSLVPNLTFWFNDLILGRSRSSVEYYLSPLQKVLKGLRVILHCKESSLFPLTWGALGLDGWGFGRGWERFFSCFQSTNCARPASRGDKGRHLGSNKQRRLTLRQAGTTVDGAIAYGRTLWDHRIDLKSSSQEYHYIPVLKLDHRCLVSSNKLNSAHFLFKCVIQTTTKCSRLLDVRRWYLIVVRKKIAS